MGCFFRKRFRHWFQIELWRMERHLEGIILSANSDAIEAVVAQLGKARDEIVAKIDALEAAVGNGEDLSGPLAELRAVAQGLDDVVPDEVPAEEPAE